VPLHHVHCAAPPALADVVTAHKDARLI
jgi:hypothetical protein